MSPGILFLGAKEMQGLNYSMPYLLNNKHGSLYQNKIPATITLRNSCGNSQLCFPGTISLIPYLLW